MQGADLAAVADTTIERICVIVDFMLSQEPGLHVVLQGLVPRGTRSRDTGEITFEQPSMYDDALWEAGLGQSFLGVQVYSTPPAHQRRHAALCWYDKHCRVHTTQQMNVNEGRTVLVHIVNKQHVHEDLHFWLSDIP